MVDLFIDQCSFPICVLKAPVLISNLLRCGILLVLSSYVGKLKHMVIQDIKSSNKIGGGNTKTCTAVVVEPTRSLHYRHKKICGYFIFINDQTMHEVYMSCTMYYCGTVFITLVTISKRGQLCLINTPV